MSFHASQQMLKQPNPKSTGLRITQMHSINLKQHPNQSFFFFTGSDWCSWCKKLESEALNTNEFAQIAGDKFIFVLLDFPSNGQYPKQNSELQARYGIQGFPTLVILDSNGNKIGSTGYQPGGGRAYAEHLLKFVK